MSMADQEVSLRDVVEWAEAQMMHLRLPSMRVMLWYLATNAWRHPDNSEDEPVGMVMSGKATLAALQRGTGLSRRQVFYTLEDLRTAGYIVPMLKPGRGRSLIAVFWRPEHDQMRADFRDGIKPLPAHFQPTLPTPEELINKGNDATIIEFPKVQRLHH